MSMQRSTVSAVIASSQVTISGQVYWYQVAVCQVSSEAWQVPVLDINNKYSMASTGIRYQIISIAWQVPVYTCQGQVTNISVRVATSNIRYQPVM